MPAPFVILSTQRSGSTYLRLWLNNHPDISCHGEVFLSHYLSPDGFRTYCEQHASMAYIAILLDHLLSRFGLRTLRLVPRQAIEYFLTSLYTDDRHPSPWESIDNKNILQPRKPSRTIGFKLLYNTMENYSHLTSWLEYNRNVRIVHLVRSNLLSVYISAMRLRSTKVAHVTNVSDSEKKRIKLYVADMMAFFQTANQTRQTYRSRFSKDRPFLEITYEQMISSPFPTISSILAFLGIDPATLPAPPSIKKIASNVLADEISNAAEVVAALAGTPFAVFLTDYTDCHPLQ